MKAISLLYLELLTINFLIIFARLKSFSSVALLNTEIMELSLVFFDKILILNINITIDIKTKKSFFILSILRFIYLKYQRATDCL